MLRHTLDTTEKEWQTVVAAKIEIQNTISSYKKGNISQMDLYTIIGSFAKGINTVLMEEYGYVLSDYTFILHEIPEHYHDMLSMYCD